MTSDSDKCYEWKVQFRVLSGETYKANDGIYSAFVQIRKSRPL